MKKCMYICLDAGRYGELFTKGNKVYSGYRNGRCEMVVDRGDYRSVEIDDFLRANIKLHMIYDEEGNYVGGDLNSSEPIPRRVRWTF